MPIPIPSNLPQNPLVDFHRNDLITPPSAPAVVESLAAIDPRVALNMPLPVGDSAPGGLLQNAIQNPANKDVSSSLIPNEPSVDQAVLLEISSLAAGHDQTLLRSDQAQVNNLLSQSLSRMDSIGSAALGQLLSDMLAVDVPELGQQLKTGESTQQAQNTVVNWPANISTQSLVADPRLTMANLYQSLQTSGIFAADQLKKLLFPTSDGSDLPTSSTPDLQAQASHLLSQLENNAPTVPDAVKLLLRGDLLWQGQLMPNVQARLYREDAWEADPKDVGQIIKGSKITMEVTLPNLGPFKVVGTQFGESVHVVIQASPDSQAVLSDAFSQLLEQMRTQVDPDAKVSMKSESGNT